MVDTSDSRGREHPERDLLCGLDALDLVRRIRGPNVLGTHRIDARPHLLSVVPFWRCGDLWGPKVFPLAPPKENPSARALSLGLSNRDQLEMDVAGLVGLPCGRERVVAQTQRPPGLDRTSTELGNPPCWPGPNHAKIDRQPHLPSGHVGV